MAKPTVCILMSTYNGEKYLREQIESILSQTDVCIKLLVRDDGSTDNTLNILEEYQQEGKLTYYQDKNIGPARSFMKLLEDAPECDYYAFSDQDDYWLPQKLVTAVTKIQDSKKESLYYGQTQLTDATLNPIASVVIRPKETFGEALVYQFVGGCTMVMNAALRKLILQYQPTYLPMHDIWIYNVAMAIGADVVFDKDPYIYYRQHNSNVIGQGYSIWEEWKRRLCRVFIQHERLRTRIAKEIKNGFEQQMPTENREILNKFLNATIHFSQRLSLITDKRYEPADKTTSRLFKLNVLLNTY